MKKHKLQQPNEGDKTTASSQTMTSGKRQSKDEDSPCVTTSKQESRCQFAPTCVTDSPYCTANCAPPAGAVGDDDFDIDDPETSRRVASEDFRVEKLQRWTSLGKQQHFSAVNCRAKRKNSNPNSKANRDEWQQHLEEEMKAKPQHQQYSQGFAISPEWDAGDDDGNALLLPYLSQRSGYAQDQVYKRDMEEAIRRSIADQQSENTEAWSESSFPPLPGASLSLPPLRTSSAWEVSRSFSASSPIDVPIDPDALSPISRESGRPSSPYLDPEAISVFQHALEEGDQQLRSVKLCFVGQARAGKTSTLLSLAGDAFNEEEPSTHGVATCSFSNELLQTPVAPEVEESNWKRIDGDDSVTVADIFENSVASTVADILKKPGFCRALSQESSMSTESSSEILKMPYNLIASKRSRSTSADKDDEKQPIVMQTWDFAGQKEYYDMVHVFLTAVGIYVFVMNLADWLPYVNNDGSGSSGKHAEELDFWLAALLLHAPQAKLIIVGTHDDELPEDLRLNVFELVQQHLEDCLEEMSSVEKQIKINERDGLFFFPVANSRKNDAAHAGISHLRANLHELAQRHVDEIGKLPTRYLHFFHVLSKWRESQHPNGFHISFDECLEKARPLGFFSGDDLQAFLKLFHNLGHLLYFPGAPAIILDPQWLLDAMANVINCERLLPDYSFYSRKLQDVGKLTPELLNRLWEDARFKGHDVILRAFLAHFDLLIEGPSNPLHWLVPSLIKPCKPQSLATPRRREPATLFLDCGGALQKAMPSILARLMFYLKHKVDPVLKVEEPIYKDHVRFRFTYKPSAEQLTVTMELVPFAMPRYMSIGISKADGHIFRELSDVIVKGLHALLPRLPQFVTKVRCPICEESQNMMPLSAQDHFLDLDEVLRGDVYCDIAQVNVGDQHVPTFVREWRELANISPLPTPQPDVDARRRELRVHYLFASPLLHPSGTKEIEQLNVYKESQILRDIPGVSMRAQVTSIDTLIQTLMAPVVADVIHLTCHCDSRDSQFLVLENSIGGSQLLTKDFLKAKICDKGLWSRCKLLVILSCRSSGLVDFILESAPCQVICCTGTVKERAVFVYIQMFYTALAAGHGVKTSHEFAQDAVRRSEDHGLTGQADMFCHRGNTQSTIDLASVEQPSYASQTQWEASKPWPARSKVDNFMCREYEMCCAANVFSGVVGGKRHRVVILLGEDGIGKSAFHNEFSCFYSAPGRLFSSGAFLLDYALLSQPASGDSPSLQEMFSKALLKEMQARNTSGLPADQRDCESSCDAVRRAISRFNAPWLLVIDNVIDGDIIQADPLFQILERLLGESDHIRILLSGCRSITRIGHDRVCFDFRLQGLPMESAAKLFDYHKRRRLRDGDFSVDSCNETAGATSGYLDKLMASPILKSTQCAPSRCVPRRILEAAQKVDHSLESLLQHPDLPN